MFLPSIFFVLTIGLKGVSSQFHPSQPARYQKLPSLRDRAQIQDQWTSERINRIPRLLKKYNAQAWLICQREHAEDTIWWSVKNATTFDAHRRTILLFHTNESALAGAPNPLVWIDNTGQVWPELRSSLESFDPDKIVLNTDKEVAFAGGLHVGELAVLQEELGVQWMKRTVNVPMLPIEYVATKLSQQLEFYHKLQEITWALIEQGFSHQTIIPGITTTEDLSWWFREKMQTLNVTTWNQPRISVLEEASYPGWEGTQNVIQEGDILHIDFGITAMGLNTDTQHMAYVLKSGKADGEMDVPESLKEGMKKSNRMQEIVLENMKPGLTGNMVLSRSLDQMKQESIDGQIYCHPIGDWGHDAGSVIGFLNFPEHVPVLGEFPILANTYYSIELYAYHFIPERNETIRFRLEENVAWSEESQNWQWVYGRQERFHLVDARLHPSDLFTDQTQV